VILKFEALEQKIIGLSVIPASGNVHAFFLRLNFFVFGLKARTEQTDRKTDEQDT